MPTFFSDPPPAVYLVLTAAVVVAGLVWLNRRDRRSRIALLAVLAVAGLVFLIDRLFESPREEAVRRVHAMVKAADTRDPDTFAAHLADTVKYQDDQRTVTFTRDQLRHAPFWELLRMHGAHVAAWDFSRDDVREIDANTIEIGFLAKGEAEGKQIPVYLRTTFTRQPDGQMKLTALASFDAVKRTNERIGLPYLPSPGK